MAKKIMIHRKTAAGYDTLYPDTHITQVQCPDGVAEAVGADYNNGQVIMESISATDKQISGYGTTSGSSKAYTLSLTDKPDMAIFDGMMIRVKFHISNDEEPTIDVNGSGAKNIYSLNQNKLLFTIAKNAWVILVYSASLDGWIVQGWAKKKVFHTEIITKTTNWVVPEIDGAINVRLFGGGGGGGGGKNAGYNNPPSGNGGGGGHMSVQTLSLNYGEVVLVTIGKGGSSDGSGGTSSLGSLLSANGGSGSNGGSGGGGGLYNANGGKGSYGGGGGGGGYGGWGGDGGTYGGGGGGNTALVTSGTYNPTWGGSGKNLAFAGGRATSQSNGGSGGGYVSASTNNLPGNGADTRGLGLDFEGEGKAGNSIGSGGGGYGGNGGDGIGGGGGGYGGNGGKGVSWGGGGGGGGYGGNGGDGNGYGGGGGGGYGLDGNGGTGAGYRSKGKDGGIAAGGGGGYADSSETFAGGNGGSGVCILTYWSWDTEY